MHPQARAILAIVSLLAFATSPALSDTGKTETTDSVFVPLDSWVYPALYRLAAMGFIPTQSSDMAPWTREECARQIVEAEDNVDHDAARHEHSAADDEALRILADLKTEILDKLGTDRNSIRLESVYTQLGYVSGTPLVDSYHFGQTVVNNYGRPLWTGINNATGVSLYANVGSFFAYARGEYQFAGGQPVYGLSTRQAISGIDSNPLLPASPGTAITRFQPEELYVGVQLGPENISVGRENLWWGPGQDSSFAFSDNAGPFYSVNFDQTTPIVLPGPLHFLGRMRTQFLFGELSGHSWPRYPQMNAQKLSFDITDDLELGIIRSAFWGGNGHPVTAGKFIASLFSRSSTGCSYGYGDRCDPGDRHTGFDFRWRLPGLRRYVTLYTDSYADDEVNPLSNPARSAWAPGIYIARVPHVPKLDLRVETYDTWLNQARNGQFFYYNDNYHDAYTNDGYLLGSYTGRQARTFVGAADYWFSGRSRLQVQVRSANEPGSYLPGGGSQIDGSATLQWSISPELLTSLTVQGEHYDIPVLGPARSDVYTAFSLVYTPLNAVLHR